MYSYVHQLSFLEHHLAAPEAASPASPPDLLRLLLLLHPSRATGAGRCSEVSQTDVSEVGGGPQSSSISRWDFPFETIQHHPAIGGYHLLMETPPCGCPSLPKKSQQPSGQPRSSLPSRVMASGKRCHRIPNKHPWDRMKDDHV